MAQTCIPANGRSTAAIIALAILLSGCGIAVPSAQTEPRSLSFKQDLPVASEEVELVDNPQQAELTTSLAALCQQFFPHRQPRAVALVFVLPDCPIANSYAAEYNRLRETFSPRGIEIILVYPDPDLTEDAMQDHAREYQISCPVLLDNQQDWARRAGATVTPEAVVFNLDGQLLYRGRIDDRYAAVGKRRQVATVHDLRDALEAIASEKPVPRARTEAVGCHIPPLRFEE